METQTLTARDLLSYKVMEHEKSTYLMQGKSNEKTLTIYHLILTSTYACNLRCKHCYLPNHDKVFLPKDVVLKVVDEWNRIVLEEKCKYGGIFHIKGGEPFVVPYLWDIIDRLIELGSLRLMLTTNGTFVSEEIFRKLRNCKDVLKGHLTIIVSLDGATGETDAKIRGNEHYSKALRFLEGLQKYDINFYLNCVLHKGNIDEPSAYIKLAKNCGATQVNFLSFIPRGSGSNLRDWQLSHSQLYEKLNELYQNGDEQTKRMLAGSMPYIKYKETCKGWPTSEECVAAYRGLLYITPDGSVFTCPNVTYPDTCLGNVFHQNLKDIMENEKDLYDRLRIHSGAYLCTGEKILYERNCDKYNQKSLDRLQCELIIQEETLDNSMNGNSKSYCFSRNW